MYLARRTIKMGNKNSQKLTKQHEPKGIFKYCNAL